MRFFYFFSFLGFLLALMGCQGMFSRKTQNLGDGVAFMGAQGGIYAEQRDTRFFDNVRSRILTADTANPNALKTVIRYHEDGTEADSAELAAADLLTPFRIESMVFSAMLSRPDVYRVFEADYSPPMLEEGCFADPAHPWSGNLPSLQAGINTYSWPGTLGAGRMMGLSAKVTDASTGTTRIVEAPSYRTVKSLVNGFPKYTRLIPGGGPTFTVTIHPAPAGETGFYCELSGELKLEGTIFNYDNNGNRLLRRFLPE